MVDIVYTAMTALLVVVVLHVAVFWVTRFIQPPKPKIVYLPAAQPQQQPQPQLIVQQPVMQAPPLPQQPPPTIQLPTYDSPPVKAAPPALPPPIETRESKGSALPQPGLPHPSV
jgi:hypothetical protein